MSRSYAVVSVGLSGVSALALCLALTKSDWYLCACGFLLCLLYGVCCVLCAVCSCVCVCACVRARVCVIPCNLKGVEKG